MDSDQRIRQALKDGRILAAVVVALETVETIPNPCDARTILAALRLFRDQVLVEATEEIASGEWCTVEEVDQLIQQLAAEEGA